MLAEPQPDNERLFLTQQDVERLLEDNSIDSRIDVVKKISKQYVGHVFHGNELAYAEQIFRLLMRDTEMRVRQELARCLQNAEDVPRDVIVALANDHERIAAPVIRSSEVLSDADLIRIIERSHEVGKLDAIAGRPGVTERVSHALVETHYPQVIRTLLENPLAQIAGRDYDTILEEHQKEPHITEAIARRAQLPLPIAEKVIHFVSEELVQELQQKYNVRLDDARQKAQEAMTLQLLPHRSSDEEIENTVKQMISFDRLTPSIILSALCQGHIRFFDIAMARLAKIPKANARKLIRDKGAYGFEALYEKAGMPDSLFEAVRILLNAILMLERNPSVEPGTSLYTGMVIEHMQQQAANEPIENLQYLIELVRQSMTHSPKMH